MRRLGLDPDDIVIISVYLVNTQEESERLRELLDGRRAAAKKLFHTMPSRRLMKALESDDPRYNRQLWKGQKRHLWNHANGFVEWRFSLRRELFDAAQDLEDAVFWGMNPVFWPGQGGRRDPMEMVKAFETALQSTNYYKAMANALDAGVMDLQAAELKMATSAETVRPPGGSGVEPLREP